MKVTKTQNKEFIKKANELFINMGFVRTNDCERYEYKINTKIGYFYLTVNNDNTFCFGVHANFMEFPDKAKLYFNHWKQNVYSTQANVIDALNEIELFYTNILKIVS